MPFYVNRIPLRRPTPPKRDTFEVFQVKNPRLDEELRIAIQNIDMTELYNSMQSMEDAQSPQYFTALEGPTSFPPWAEPSAIAAGTIPPPPSRSTSDLAMNETELSEEMQALIQAMETPVEETDASQDLDLAFESWLNSTTSSDEESWSSDTTLDEIERSLWGMPLAEFEALTAAGKMVEDSNANQPQPQEK